MGAGSSKRPWRVFLWISRSWSSLNWRAMLSNASRIKTATTWFKNVLKKLIPRAFNSSLMPSKAKYDWKKNLFIIIFYQFNFFPGSNVIVSPVRLSSYPEDPGALHSRTNRSYPGGTPCQHGSVAPGSVRQLCYPARLGARKSCKSIFTAKGVVSLKTKLLNFFLFVSGWQGQDCECSERKGLAIVPAQICVQCCGEVCAACQPTRSRRPYRWSL